MSRPLCSHELWWRGFRRVALLQRGGHVHTGGYVTLSFPLHVNGSCVACDDLAPIELHRDEMRTAPCVNSAVKKHSAGKILQKNSRDWELVVSQLTLLSTILLPELVS